MEIKVNAKLWANPATSVKSKSTAKISVHPNPAHDFITINNGETQAVLEGEGEFVVIYNTFGEKVKLIEQGKSSSKQINISTLPNGTYFVKVGKESLMFIKM
jgi:hypothetical protein